LVIDPAFFGIASESFFSRRLLIAAAPHRNGVATIATRPRSSFRPLNKRFHAEAPYRKQFLRFPERASTPKWAK
jgi:hypothetical protein